MPNGNNDQPYGWWTVAVTLLGAAAGITGFVALVGGAILWIRFDELGLPADRAVAALPKSVLLAVGAHTVVGPIVAGLVALLFLMSVAAGCVRGGEDFSCPRKCLPEAESRAACL